MLNNSHIGAFRRILIMPSTIFTTILGIAQRFPLYGFNKQSLVDNDQRFGLAADDQQLADWEWNIATGLVRFNQNFVERAGGVVNHNTVTMDWLQGRIHSQDKTRVIAAIHNYLAAPHRPLEIVFRIYDVEHQCLTVQCRGAFARNNKSRMLGIFTFLTGSQKVERKLSRYLQLERLMSALSQQFLRGKEADVEKTIVDGLHLLTDNIDGVRSCLIHSEDHAQSKVFEWGEPIYDSMKQFVEQTEAQKIDSMCRMLNAQSVTFLPDSALDINLQKNLLHAMSSSMVIALPLQDDNLGVGCLLLGFDDLSEPWRKEDVSLLRSIADLFFIILDRESVQAKLQARQELLLENQAIAKLGSWVLDNDSEVLKCSPEVYRIFEITMDTRIDFQLFLQYVHPDDRKNTAEIIKNSMAQRTSYDFTYRIITSCGKLKYIHGRGQAILDDKGALMRLIGSVMDVTERELAEEKLRLSAIMFESTQEGALITDKDSFIIAVNKAFTDITGYSEEEALGKKPSILKSGKHDNDFYQCMNENLEREGFWQGEVWNKRKNGDYYPEWLSIKNVYDDNDKLSNCVAIFSDISHIKKTEEQIEKLSHHDPLTGLPNRLLFQSRLSHALDIAKRNEYQLALICIDIDNFKKINDSLGHNIGDEVLVMISDRLQDRVRESDTLARLGGNEFVLLLEKIEGVEQAAYVAQSILDILAEPFQFEDGKDVFIGASLGVSCYPNDGLSATDLINHADAAVSKAKDDGRNNVHFYTLELTKSAQARMQLESELRRVIAEKTELQLYYQPQVCMTSGEVVGAEALLRWHHPQDGIISPVTFLPVAEKTGLMAALDYWVLETACRQHTQWKKLEISAFILAINITKYSFMDPHFLSKINAIISKTGIDPKTIELEITEGALIEPTPLVIQTIAELKHMGFTLAIDDFGTGYSSLAYLQRFNVDKLKIDRSFVKDLLIDPQGEAITSAIISMAKSLDLQILAEGVENQQQLALLKEKGCEVYQGFYFSKPIAVKDFEALMLEYKP